LVLWGFPHKGYKRTVSKSAPAALQQRVTILTALEEASGERLSLADEVRDALFQNDDAFDSFICALIARAAATERTFSSPKQPTRQCRA